MGAAWAQGRTADDGQHGAFVLAVAPGEGPRVKNVGVGKSARRVAASEDDHPTTTVMTVTGPVVVRDEHVPTGASEEERQRGVGGIV